MAEPAWLSITNICETYDVSPKTVRRWIAAGDVESIRRGRLVRVNPASVEQLFTRMGA